MHWHTALCKQSRCLLLLPGHVEHCRLLHSGSSVLCSSRQTIQEINGINTSNVAIDEWWNPYRTCWSLIFAISALFKITPPASGSWGNFEKHLDRKYHLPAPSDNAYIVPPQKREAHLQLPIAIAACNNVNMTRLWHLLPSMSVRPDPCNVWYTCRVCE